MEAHPYKVVISGKLPRNPLLAYIPHSATRIGPRQRKQILLSDEDLQREIVRLTDWHTDHLFSWVLVGDVRVGAVTLELYARKVYCAYNFRRGSYEAATTGTADPLRRTARTARGL